MKRFYIILLIIIAHTSLMAQNIRVITYNIRYNNPGDGINAWPNRSKDVAALLDFHKADLFGLQEALIGQIEDIQKQLPDMTWVGVGRDDGKNSGEFSPIFYNKTKFNEIKSGWFWLSETPGKPGLGWDAACNRVCTWILLETGKKDRQFLIFNTHFDHIGTKARVESAKLILKKIKELNPGNLPVILTGDFNMTPEHESIALISKDLKDSKSISKKAPYGPEGTFNSFKFDAPMKDRIDYVFVNAQVEVLQYSVLTDSKDQRYPSDHQPVLVDLEIKSGKK